MFHAFSYVELHSQNPARAREFYGSLFGWKMSDSQTPGSGTYTSIETGEGPGGGLMKAMNSQQPSTWVVYVNVDNLAAFAQRVRELGGQVLQERIEVPGHGAFAVVADPTGAVFNLWQKAA